MAQKFQVTIDIDAEITKLQQKLNSLNSSIGNGSKFGGKYQQDIDQAIQRLDELRKKAASPLTSKSDYGQVVKDIKAVEGELNNLYNRASQAKPIDLLSKDTIKHLDDAQKAVDATTQKTKQLSDAEKEVNKALNAQAAAQDKINKAQQQNKAVAANNYLKAKDAYVKKFQEIDGGKHASNDITKGNLAAIANGTYTGTSYTKEDLAILQQYAAEMKDCEATMKSLGATAADANGSTRKMFSQTEMNDFITKLNDANTAVQNAQTNLNNLSTQEAVKQFNDLKLAGQNLGLDMSAYTGVNDIQAMATEVEQAMNKITNSNQGVQSLLNQINQLKQEINQLKAESDKAGKSIDNMTEAQKQMSMVESRAKYFFSFMNGVNLLKRGVKSAISTIKELDQAMTEMAVVTQYDIGDLWNTMPQMTQHAKDLGVAVKDVYEATTLYTQQGIEFNTAVGLSVQTLKMARIAGLDAATATDRLTNAMRAFNMEVTEESAARVSDIYSAVAARTASNVDELSTAMTKVASLAANVGMTIEQTTAYLATGIETTRESADSIGTALKTVLARFAEMKKDPSMQEAVDGEVVNVNKVEEALRSVGIALRDEQGQFRSMGDVFQELNAKWGTLTNNQQRYIATMAAGSRQQSRFIAMMQDATRTSEIYSIATDSAGKSQEQFEKTVESFQSKVAKLKDTWNEFLMGLANNDIVKGAIDLLTNILDIINKVTTIPESPGLTALVKLAAAFVGFKIAKGVLLGSISALSGALKVSGDLAIYNVGAFKGVSVELAKIGGLAGKAAAGLTTVTTQGIGATTSMSALKASLGAAGSGFKALGIAIWESLPILALVGATILLIVEGVRQITSNTPDAQINKAKNALSDLNSELNDTNSQITSLEDNTEKLKELESEFATLTKGTKEYSDKLREINDLVIDIASTDISIKTTINSEGKLGINEDSYENYLRKIKQQQQSQAGAVLLQEQYYNTLTTRKSGNQKAQEIADKVWDNNGGFVSNERLTAFAEILAKNNIEAADANKDNLIKIGNALGITTEQVRDIINENTAALNELVGLYRTNIANEKELNKRLVAAYTNEDVENNTRVLGQSIINLDNSSEAIDAELRKNIETKYTKDDLLMSILNMPKFVNNFQGREDVRKYAASMGINGEWEVPFIGDVKFRVEGEEEAISPEALQKRIEGILQNDYVDEINAKIEFNFTSSERDLLADFFSGNVESELYGNDISGIAQRLGFPNIYNFASSLGTDVDTLTESIEAANATIKQQRDTIKNNVIKSLYQFSDKLNLTNDVCDTFRATIENLDFKSQQALANGITSVQSGGDNGLAAFWGSFANTGMTSDYLQSQEYIDFVSEVSKFTFDSAISGAAQLNKYLKSDNQQLKDFAIILKSVDGISYNAGSQIGQLLDETQFEDLNKQLEKVYKKNQEITATDIDSLKEQYEELDQVLENTSLSSEKLATAFTLISEGTINATVFTDQFVEALNKVTTTAESVASVHSWIENFKEVTDTGEGVDFLNDMFEKTNIFLKNYEYGNDIVENYIKAVFGRSAWENAIDGTQEEAEKAISEYLEKLNRYTIGDGYGFWKDLGKNNSMLGTAAQIGMGADGSITIDLFNKATEDDLIKAIQQTQGVTKEAAQSILNTVLSHDIGLKQQLDANGYERQLAELEATAQKIVTATGEQLSVYTNDQIDFLSESYDKEYSQVIKDMQATTQAAILDWRNIDFTKSAQEIYSKFEQAMVSNSKNGLNFDDIFRTSISTEGGINYLDLDKYIKQATALGMDQTQAESIANGWAAATGGQISQMVEVYGEEMGREQKRISADSADNLRKDIDDALEKSDIDKWLGVIHNSMVSTANDFATAISTALSGIKLVGPDGETIASFNTSGVNKALNNKKNASTNGNDRVNSANARAKATAEALKKQEEAQKKLAEKTAKENYDREARQEQVTQAKLKKTSTSVANWSDANKAEERNNRATSPDYWKRSFDWLYTLLDHIEVETKRIANSQQKQELLLTQSRYSDDGNIRSLIRESQKELRKQIHLIGDYSNMQDLRRQEMEAKISEASHYRVTGTDRYGEEFETYVDFTKYFSVINDEIRLDEEAIRELQNDRDRGSEYGSALSEILNGIKSARDGIYDAEAEEIKIRKTLEDERNQGFQDFTSFVDRIAGALQAIDEKALEQLQEQTDALNTIDEEIVNAAEANIQQLRQLEDNADQEEEISDLSRRIAYLRQDTTGANQLEIKKLEKQLSGTTKSYKDSLVDQALAEMKTSNEFAASQREKQIELTQAIITFNEENGIYTQKAEAAILNAYDENGNFDVYDSGIYDILFKGEGWLALSEGQKRWKLEELRSTMASTGEWLVQWGWDAFQGKSVEQSIDDALRDREDSYWDSAISQIISALGQLGDALETTIRSYEEPDNDDYDYDYEPPYHKGTEGGNTGENGAIYKNSGNGFSALAAGGGGTTYYNIDTKEVIINGTKTTTSTAADYLKSHGRYASGGLNTETGPAWLDGTKQKPEIVLKPSDSANFMELRDLLRSIKNKGYLSSDDSASKIYDFDVDINVASLDNDYDVDKLADKVENRLVSAMNYRNVTAVNFLK